MKTLATIALSVVLALPATAAVVHNEGTDGDLSSDPNTPTPVVFSLGSNTIIGSCGNVGSPVDIRDYIRFTISAPQKVVMLILPAFAPDNVAFASFNSGPTSFIPNATTDPNFLAGIHILGTDQGTDILPRFVDRTVTQNALAQAELGPGDYCFLIQQTSPITTTYELDFILDTPLPAQTTTWGKIRSLYR